MSANDASGAEIPQDLQQDWTLIVNSLQEEGDAESRRVLGQLRYYILRIAKAESELALCKKRCEWQEITPENLPQIGDEVGGYDPAISVITGMLRIWTVRRVNTPMARARNAVPQNYDWQRLGYTHFRAIDPPRTEPIAGDQNG